MFRNMTEIDQEFVAGNFENIFSPLVEILFLVERIIAKGNWHQSFATKIVDDII